MRASYDRVPVRPILCPHPADRRVDYPPPIGTVCVACGAACPVRRGLEEL